MTNILRNISLAAVIMLAAAACRQEQKPQQQMQTFRQQTAAPAATSAPTSPAPTSPAPTSAPTSSASPSTPPNLLKQHVARGVSDMILTRKAYAVSYNKRRLTPNWVAWTLTAEHTRGNLLRDEERFEEDPQVPQPRATWQDYYNSRYDRGHMCPAGDNKWDQEAMTQSFLMTNVCPQNHGLNKEDWNELEMQCRTWARRFGEVTIVCGPLYEGDDPPRSIGRNKVQVPTGFFKVVYRDKPKPQAVAFIFRNNGSSQPWSKQTCTVDEAEKRSGIDFLYQLPDDVEDLVEANADLEQW